MAGKEDSHLQGMVSPILLPQTHEGPNILMLDESDRLDWLVVIHGWYATMYVDVNRVNGPSVVFKVYLTKKTLAVDLLRAFKIYLGLGNSVLFYHNVEVPSDSWLDNASNANSYLLLEDGAKREISLFD